MASRKRPDTGNEDTIPCACGCGTPIARIGADRRPRHFVPGHQFRGNTYGQKSYSLEHILEQAEPLRPLCQCGCGEKLDIPAFLRQKGRGIQSIQTYWKKHPYKKSHGLWIRRTEHFRHQSQSLSTEMLGLIYGTLLGDGSIAYPNRHSRFPRLAWTHGPQQQEWMEYKASRLAALRPQVYATANAGYGSTSVCCRTACHPDLVSVYDQVKGNTTGENPVTGHPITGTKSRKRVSQSWLSQVSLEGLSWWYMDDGSLSLSPQGSPQIQFHTEGYTYAENLLIAEWLTGLGYPVKVRTYQRGHNGKRYCYIAMGAETVRRWLADLQPFSIPSMDYKFGAGRICTPRWD